MESAAMESAADTLTKPWECAICLRLLYQPATLPCGHSTCRTCLISCLEHARVCPECRAPIPFSLAVPACSTSLQAALLRLFPEETAARAAEEAAAAAAPGASDGGGIAELPLFVLDAMVPGQRLQLHVFEDRYLKLVRRALAQPERHFGMVAARGSGHAGLVVHGRGPLLEQRIAHVGSLVVIENVSDLGGGARLLVEIRATRRFRALRFRQHADGYACAQAEWMLDASPPSAEDAHAALVLGRELRCAIDAWVEQVRRRGREREPGQLERLLAQLGAVPPPSEPEALGFWAAAVVNPLPPLGLAAEVRPSCLSCDESAQRLRLCLAAVEESMAHVCQKGLLERIVDAAAPAARLLRRMEDALGGAAGIEPPPEEPEPPRPAEPDGRDDEADGGARPPPVPAPQHRRIVSLRSLASELLLTYPLWLPIGLYLVVVGLQFCGLGVW